MWILLSSLTAKRIQACHGNNRKEQQSFHLHIQFALNLTYFYAMETLKGADLDREKNPSPKSLDLYEKDYREEQDGALRSLHEELKTMPILINSLWILSVCL